GALFAAYLHGQLKHGNPQYHAQGVTRQRGNRNMLRTICTSLYGAVMLAASIIPVIILLTDKII
ncbi:MAG TPA: hypothetical protein VIU36_03460, partial [Gammaproteobacteria bacterium]